MRKTFGSDKQWRRQTCELGGLNNGQSANASHSQGQKLVYLAISVLMLIIGLAGIIIPIIPGLLFLAVALFYLGKVFPSIKSLSDSHPVLGKVNDRIDQMSEIKMWDRIKVAALMSAEAATSAISAMLTYGAEKLRKHKPPTY